MERTKEALRRFYTDHLTEVVLPYWLARSDEELGGFYTCIDPTGATLLSTDKYVWSQGRCVWMYSRLAADPLVRLSDETRERCRLLAQKGAAFLEGHCLTEGPRAVFLVDRQGRPKEAFPGAGLCPSAFADCFAAMGLAAWAELCRWPEPMDAAWGLFQNAVKLAEEGRFPTAPDQLPDGWRSQAVSMILVNTAAEVARALRALGETEKAAWARDAARRAARRVLDDFLQPEGVLLECLSADGQPLDTLYGRHINPGHTCECMWFLLEEADWLGLSAEDRRRAMDACLATTALAWDGEFGGMMYYLDREGGAPKGRRYAPEQELADAAVRDWSNKLWWPQLEALYAHLVCVQAGGGEAHRDWFRKLHDYTFSTFPNPDKQVGEWLQLRDRAGRPLAGPVGGRLPVKDPYHITRALYLLARRLA